MQKAPGVEEFQIVEDRSWARRYFPDNEGPREDVAVPCHLEIKGNFPSASRQAVESRAPTSAMEPIGEQRSRASAVTFRTGCSADAASVWVCDSNKTRPGSVAGGHVGSWRAAYG